MGECSNSWNNMEEALEACAGYTDEYLTVKTCGFILFENPAIIVIAESYHASEVSFYTVVPKECIRKRHSLRLAKQRKKIIT